MADEALTNEQVAEMRKKRTFRKFTFRGIDLDKLLDLSMEVNDTRSPPLSKHAFLVSEKLSPMKLKIRTVVPYRKHTFLVENLTCLALGGIALDKLLNLSVEVY